MGPPPLTGGRTRRVERSWPNDTATAEALATERDDLLVEQRQTTNAASDDHSPRAAAEAEFTQRDGPFTDYRRTVRADGDRLTETTVYSFVIPWFAWLFAWPTRRHLARRHLLPRRLLPGRLRPDAGSSPGGDVRPAAGPPAWAPPDRLDARAVAVLGLLAAASMTSAYVNTLFTQTVSFAADDFGVGDTGIGIAGAVVRAGIILVLPLAVMADRIGRRRVVAVLAVAAPAVTACGAIAPSFPFLVATQTLGRPLGLALDFLVAVIAAEEMPRNSRAYAVSILAMASGLGAGVAVGSLPLADVSVAGWRYVYAISLIWLVVAVSIVRHLPESRRFSLPHAQAPRLPGRRLAILGATAALTNVFVAPASFFQNRYLDEMRGFSATMIALFTLTTATPAAVGLIVGGRLADTYGRRRVIVVALPLTTALLVASYSIGGPLMWVAVFFAGIAGGVAVPAAAVYRAELFPTGGRSLAAALLTAAALLGGIGGLLVAGFLVDRGWSYGSVMALLGSAQIAVVAIVIAAYPETAHRELDELNPADRVG